MARRQWCRAAPPTHEPSRAGRCAQQAATLSEARQIHGEKDSRRRSRSIASRGGQPEATRSVGDRDAQEGGCCSSGPRPLLTCGYRPGPPLRLVAVRTGPSARGKRTLIRATSGCSWRSAPSVPATECSLGDKARRARSWANCCPDGEHRRCGVRTRDRQGERSGLYDLNRVLDGCRAPTGSVVQLSRDLGLLGDRRWATRS